jgi:prevent-host-death family protein
MEVSVRELKNHLSEYLRRAHAGEQIKVTSRGRVVATLSAPEKPDQDGMPEQELVRHLERMPWIRPPRKGSAVKGSDRPVAVPDGTGDEIVDWLRGG